MNFNRLMHGFFPFVFCPSFVLGLFSHLFYCRRRPIYRTLCVNGETFTACLIVKVGFRPQLSFFPLLRETFNDCPETLQLSSVMIHKVILPGVELLLANRCTSLMPNMFACFSFVHAITQNTAITTIRYRVDISARHFLPNVEEHRVQDN